MPAYDGRIPGNAIEFFRCLGADRTPAVVILSYGARDYGDALCELKDRCEGKGFVAIAAGAFVGEHALAPVVSKGRPDTADLKTAFDFGLRIKRRIETLARIEDSGALRLRGRAPYRRRIDRRLGPTTGPSCRSCGLCARSCPMAAIDPADPRKVDLMRCLPCFRCIRDCPYEAKYLEGEAFSRSISELAASCGERNEAELII